MGKSNKPPDISGIPKRPGCYLMKSGEGRVLYVGKAINLRSRVRSYFTESAKHTSRIALMVSMVRNVNFIVTQNEVEALILENNLIKEKKPRFNVMLRDDKTYPYLKLTTYEKFPRLLVVRKVMKDGSTYFGPYVSAKSVRYAKHLIHRVFPIRSSKDNLDNAPPRRPCLNRQMKRCLGPCSGKVGVEEYGQMVQGVTQFLRGRDAEVVKTLGRRMHEAAAKEEFERAAEIRDQIKALDDIHKKQKIDSVRQIDEDYIAAICEGGVGIVRIMMVRNGKLRGDQNFEFKKADDIAELTGAFIQQFYNSAFAVPSQVIVNVAPADGGVVQRWLTELKGAKAEIVIPERGRRRKLLDMAVENARFNLISFTSGEESRKEALGEIQKALGLKKWPAIIEGIDISNISGLAAVGSLVSFFNGAPDKKNYRRYRVTVIGPDDYAMITEVVARRFKRLKEEGENFPDLLLIDGGAGQVSAAAKAVEKFAPGQAIVGIAKGGKRDNSATDRFFVPGKKMAVEFARSSAGRFMLQRVRDEAHRFAIQYHRKTREKSAFKSGVEEVKGFGPKRKKKLVQAFGSLKAAKDASVEDIRKALSINERLAIEIHQKL